MNRLSLFLPLVALTTLMLGCAFGDGPKSTFGVVTFAQGGIGIIDTDTQTVGAPLLTTELGTMGGGRFDVVITPDGSTTLVSNFGDSQVFFIDTTKTTAPAVLGSVEVGFFAEDIALTPNGKFALVTDGGYSSKIAVINVATRALVETYTAAEIITDPTTEPPTGYTPMFQSVVVSSDGTTVLAADYFNGMLEALTIDASGHLTFVSSIDLSPTSTTVDIHPINVSISPNGKVAVVAASADAVDMVFPVLTITAPGIVHLSDSVSPSVSLQGAQSVVFNSDGTKAYLNCVQEVTDPAPVVPLNNLIVELNVSAAGGVTESGNTVEMGFNGTSELYGVDTLAMDPMGQFLYVSNMTLGEAKNQIQVVDVKNHTIYKTVSFDPIDIDADGKADLTLPTGIYIKPF